MNNKYLINIIRGILIIVTPLFLTVFMEQLIISWDSPSYPEWEYARIPPDRYGFTPEERLELAEATLAYLRHPDPAEKSIRLLEELRMPGTDAPLYNPAEISHMIDVKVVSDKFKTAMWLFGLTLAAGYIFLFARPQTRPVGAKTVMQSGIFTVTAVFLVMLFIGIGWSLFFTLFHEIFFAAGTWTFRYTDSLIRLFPEQFWFDIALIWTGGILVLGGILALIGYGLQKYLSRGR